MYSQWICGIAALAMFWLAGTARAQTGCADLERAMTGRLEDGRTGAPFSVYLENKAGGSFSYSRAGTGIDTPYRIASCTKMISAAVILRQVDKGVLSLDDSPSKYIPEWPRQGPLADATLAHLLSFTSGLKTVPLCIANGRMSLEQCALRAIRRNMRGAAQAGTEFHYLGAHLPVAALMAIRASGAGDWQELVEVFQNETGLLTRVTFDNPSRKNPNLAGGLEMTGADYADFLRAWMKGELFSAELTKRILRNHTQPAKMVNSPALKQQGLEWGYGFGFWVECVPNARCRDARRISSAGAAGFYPVIDYKDGYFGVLSQRGPLNSFVESVDLLSSLDDLAARWSEARCR